MTTTSVDDVVLRLAMPAYPGRYTGTSRRHSESDLRIYLAWCAERDLAPLTVGRQQVELYVRWMQEVRRCFYRTCVIDAVLEHSPAEYVRRPRVPNESTVLGLSHLQFEAILAAARESANRFDFALVAMHGLLGLRISEASGADVEDLGEEHGHRVLLVHADEGNRHQLPMLVRRWTAHTAWCAARSASQVEDLLCLAVAEITEDQGEQRVLQRVPFDLTSASL
jgi:integrase/recombinase XerD